jgi:hypothetical protein
MQPSARSARRQGDQSDWSCGRRDLTMALREAYLRGYGRRAAQPAPYIANVCSGSLELLSRLVELRRSISCLLNTPEKVVKDSAFARLDV